MRNNKNYDEFRTSLCLRPLQEAEIRRFKCIKLYTTSADAARDVFERGIQSVLKERNLEPLDFEEAKKYMGGKL